MKVVVSKKFRDKYTDEVYKVGRLLELTPERYEEIRSTDVDLVAAVEAEPEYDQEPEAAGPGTADQEPEAAGPGTADQEPEAAGPGTADQEPEAAGAEQEIAGQKPKRTKRRTKKDE